MAITVHPKKGPLGVLPSGVSVIPGAGPVWVATAGGLTTLTADSGSFAVTGTATSLKYDRLITAVSGSFALSGTAVAFDYTKRIDAASGSYAITGSDVGFLYSQVIAADSGSFALTGTDVVLTYTPLGITTLTADSGSYSVTGTAVDFLRDLVIPATSGTYALTGTNVDFALEIIFQADSGSFAVTGTDVGFLYNQVIQAESGSFALSGSDVTLTYNREEEEIAAATGGSGYIGADAFLDIDRLKYPEEKAEKETSKPKKAEKPLKLVTLKAVQPTETSILKLAQAQTDQKIVEIQARIDQGTEDERQLANLQKIMQVLEARRLQEMALFEAANDEEAIQVLIMNDMMQENAVIDYVLSQA